MEHETIHLILNAVDTGGTIAVLVLMLVLFYRGEIVPRASVREIIETTVAEVLAHMREDN